MAPSPHEIPPALENLIGETIAGRYRVDRCIGLGGMAVVFLGRHEALDRTVAIKALRPELESVSTVLERFNREAKIASHLEHPNCVQVFDFGKTASGITFMVMPFLDGIELHKVVAIPFAPSQAIALCTQILRGLEYLHRCGVIHRDLKPDNVFITRDHDGRDILRIVDFGVSKLLERAQVRDDVHTRMGTIVGTPTHMAPEQALGLDADARSDLYSLGIILYQLLTATLPFDAPEPKQLLRKQVHEPPPPLPSHIPRQVQGLVARLIAKDPADRFPSATDTLMAFAEVSRNLANDPTPWRPLLPTMQTIQPSPSVPPLGGQTLVASQAAPTMSNQPPSERSGFRAVPTGENWPDTTPPHGIADPLQRFGAALDNLLNADDSQSDMLVDLYDGIEEVDAGDQLVAPYFGEDEK